MTQEEHLNRIVAKCRELLAGAEKRTPGKWTFGVRYVFAPATCDEVAKCPFTEQGKRDSWMTDAAFIASCAGPAEAGWRATIAAIDMLQKDYESLNDAGNKDGMRVIQWRMDEIIAAWPEELL